MRYLSSALLMLSLSGVPMYVGCDRTVSHDESSKTESDGTVKTQDSTVKVDQNGNTIKEDTKTTDKPAANP
jgi:hypothetical protein